MDDIQGFIWYFYNVLTFSLLIKYNAFWLIQMMSLSTKKISFYGYLISFSSKKHMLTLAKRYVYAC